MSSMQSPPAKIDATIAIAFLPTFARPGRSSRSMCKSKRSLRPSLSARVIGSINPLLETAFESSKVTIKHSKALVDACI
ncbi:hypothetical protein AXFE_24740 [Acidithrix ferrooxidans]|uniref:Uncharacterized protein n=1 Tax=Acidithrix ferrooxidans TaxID=1280514 RepID=A0A0D8HFP2_9ACTN|nr:hypothetical protein AXFE_24740 [Acidithrix ferrooxidans]